VDCRAVQKNLDGVHPAPDSSEFAGLESLKPTIRELAKEYTNSHSAINSIACALYANVLQISTHYPAKRSQRFTSRFSNPERAIDLRNLIDAQYIFTCHFRNEIYYG
jgi:hypothetical protein